MLKIKIPAGEDLWDENKGEFVPGSQDYELWLEHSLYAISKWEEKYERPFIGDGSEAYEKTPDEFMDYIKCMTIPHRGKYPDESVYKALTRENILEINEYMAAKHCGTTITYIGPKQQSHKQEIISAELVYCWMILLNIPIEFDKWHINKLLVLIELTGIKNDPNPKKMNARENAAWRKAQNAQRRAKSKAKK